MSRFENKQMTGLDRLVRSLMKVKVNTWTVPAYWSWDVQNEDVCGICQVAYDACCPTCTVPGDGCPLIWGECSHVFHMHCLIKWLNAPNSQEQCPMDRTPWKTAAATQT